VATVDPPATSPDAADPTPAHGTAKRSPWRGALEWVAVIGGALVLAFVIRTFLLAAFYIPSESMLDTLEVGDRVLVNKLSYRLHDVNRGDVVVFERPPSQPDSGIKDLIKRVIGLPGETIEGRGCQIYVTPAGSTETFVLEEPYLDRGWTLRCDSGPITLGPDQLWVRGDNRDDSEDSRFFGPISEDLVVGRAFVIVWPLGELGWL
jgi:signal peptidase I